MFLNWGAFCRHQEYDRHGLCFRKVLGLFIRVSRVIQCKLLVSLFRNKLDTSPAYYIFITFMCRMKHNETEIITGSGRSAT